MDDELELILGNISLYTMVTLENISLKVAQNVPNVYFLLLNVVITFNTVPRWGNNNRANLTIYVVKWNR